jgi:hypothetical protein
MYGRCTVLTPIVINTVAASLFKKTCPPSSTKRKTIVARELRHEKRLVESAKGGSPMLLVAALQTKLGKIEFAELLAERVQQIK